MTPFRIYPKELETLKLALQARQDAATLIGKSALTEAMADLVAKILGPLRHPIAYGCTKAVTVRLLPVPALRIVYRVEYTSAGKLRKAAEWHIDYLSGECLEVGT